MTVQFTGAINDANARGVHMEYNTRAHEHDNGKFQGFVHVVFFHDGGQEEMDFPCAAIRDTEEEALADAVRLARDLPPGKPPKAADSG